MKKQSVLIILLTIVMTAASPSALPQEKENSEKQEEENTLTQIWKSDFSDITYPFGAGQNTLLMLTGLDDDETKLTAANLKSGNKKWSLDVNLYSDESDQICIPVVWQDRAVYGTKSGTLKSVRLDNGNTIWSTEINGKMPVSPAISNGLVFTGIPEEKLSCHRIENGKTVWSREKNIPDLNRISATPTSLFLVGESRISRCNPNNGRRIWTKDERVRGFGLTSSDHPIVLTKEEKVKKLRSGNGKTFWTEESGEPDKLSSKFSGFPSLLVGQKHVYIAGKNQITARSIQTGEKLWNHKKEDVDHSYMITAGKYLIWNHYHIKGSTSPTASILDATTGKVIRNMKPSGTFFAYPISHRGKLVLSGFRGPITAYGVKPGFHTGWNNWGGNAGHTGNPIQRGQKDDGHGDRIRNVLKKGNLKKTRKLIDERLDPRRSIYKLYDRGLRTIKHVRNGNLDTALRIWNRLSGPGHVYTEHLEIIFVILSDKTSLATFLQKQVNNLDHEKYDTRKKSYERLQLSGPLALSYLQPPNIPDSPEATLRAINLKRKITRRWPELPRTELEKSKNK